MEGRLSGQCKRLDDVLRIEMDRGYWSRVWINSDENSSFSGHASYSRDTLIYFHKYDARFQISKILFTNIESFLNPDLTPLQFLPQKNRFTFRKKLSFQNYSHFI